MIVVPSKRIGDGEGGGAHAGNKTHPSVAVSGLIACWCSQGASASMAPRRLRSVYIRRCHYHGGYSYIRGGRRRRIPFNITPTAMTTLLLIATVLSCFFLICDLSAAMPTVTSKKDYHELLTVPSVEEAARIARTLVQRESLGNLATIDGTGFPVAFSEYYVDGFADGDPVLIMLNISSTWRNIKNSPDGKLSFSIRTGDHQPKDRVNSHYPGGIAFSTAGSPRISLKGHIKPFEIKDPLEAAVLEAKFVKRHPDAKFWLPKSKISAHSGFWAKIEVDSVYFIGGFGDRAYIGDIPVDIYHGVEPLSAAEYEPLLSDIEAKNSKFQNLVQNYKVPSHAAL